MARSAAPAARPRRPVASIALAGLHVLLLSAIAFCWLEARWEDRVFERIVLASVDPRMSDSEAALALRHAVHELVGGRNRILQEHAGGSRSGPFANALLVALVEGGACGAHSLVLVRALREAGIDARVVQMRARGVWGAHIVVSARLDGDWVILDPLFDLSFRDGDGRLVGVEELGARWQRYAGQAPPDYPPEYDYSAVRYTNWEKIPVLMPALRAGAAALLGEEAVETFSLRTHLLNVHRVYAVALLAFYLPLLAFTLVRWRRTGPPA